MEAKYVITINVLPGLTEQVKMPRLGCLIANQKATFYDAGNYKKLVMYLSNVVFNEGTEYEFKHNVFAERVLFEKRELIELKKMLGDNVGSTFDVTVTLVPVVKGMNEDGQAMPMLGEKGGVAGRMICKITKIEWAKRLASFKGIVAPPTKKNSSSHVKPSQEFEGLM